MPISRKATAAQPRFLTGKNPRTKFQQVNSKNQIPRTKTSELNIPRFAFWFLVLGSWFLVLGSWFFASLVLRFRYTERDVQHNDRQIERASSADVRRNCAALRPHESLAVA